MRLPPRLHPRHILSPAEVVRILRPALPAPLARRLARPPTFRLAAILLMMAIARIRNEERPAVQAFASAFGVHRPKPLHRLAASTKPRHQNRRTHPKGRRSTPTRRTSFLVNQGRKSYGRISAVPTATIAALSFRRWQSNSPRNTRTARIAKLRNPSASFSWKGPPASGDPTIGQRRSGPICCIPVGSPLAGGPGLKAGFRRVSPSRKSGSDPDESSGQLR